MPVRIQMSRARGWRMPAGAIVVARPSRWGNPYLVSDYGRVGAVRLYREWITSQPDLIATAVAQLRGRDLACWCPPGQPCHADVLLEIANGGPP